MSTPPCWQLVTAFRRPFLGFFCPGRAVKHRPGTVRQHELRLVPPFRMCMFLLFPGHLCMFIASAC